MIKRFAPFYNKVSRRGPQEACAPARPRLDRRPQRGREPPGRHAARQLRHPLEPGPPHAAHRSRRPPHEPGDRGGARQGEAVGEEVARSHPDPQLPAARRDRDPAHALQPGAEQDPHDLQHPRHPGRQAHRRVRHVRRREGLPGLQGRVRRRHRPDRGAAPEVARAGRRTNPGLDELVERLPDGISTAKDGKPAGVFICRRVPVLTKATTTTPRPEWTHRARRDRVGAAHSGRCRARPAHHRRRDRSRARRPRPSHSATARRSTRRCASSSATRPSGSAKRPSCRSMLRHRRRSAGWRSDDRDRRPPPKAAQGGTEVDRPTSSPSCSTGLDWPIPDGLDLGRPPARVGARGTPPRSGEGRQAQPASRRSPR